jgi:hypothetical protein
MPRGTSGRVVVEIDPELKGRLHATLAFDRRTLKDWFVEQAREYVASRSVLATNPENKRVARRGAARVQR